MKPLNIRCKLAPWCFKRQNMQRFKKYTWNISHLTIWAWARATMPWPFGANFIISWKKTLKMLATKSCCFFFAMMRRASFAAAAALIWPNRALSKEEYTKIWWYVTMFHFYVCQNILFASWAIWVAVVCQAPRLFFLSVDFLLHSYIRQTSYFIPRW